MSSKHPETLALHAGWRRDSATNAVAVPIYQTTSYQFDSAEHAANLFALKELGQHLHPHHEPDQRRAGAADGGDRGRRGGAGAASGQAASAFSMQNLARAGDNIVSSTDLYGGTWNLFANTLKDQGIEVALRRSGRPRGLRPRHRRPDPRLLRRDAAQPEADRVPDRRGRRDRPVASASR